jgi:hypothetical protein
MISDDEIRARYGSAALISRKAHFVLVHLDRPTADAMRLRTEAFDPSTYFQEDCPLCAIQRAQGIVVFDADPDDAEEILIE